MKVEYLGGGFNPGEFPDSGLPEAAFVGRSNVGKSSLINTLVGQRQLARVSSTPGRTQALHFFTVGDELCLVDLPGYGYAKAPVAVRKAWQPLVSSYIDHRENLRLGLLLVDIRREPRTEEHGIVELFRGRGTPLLLVVTKADKVAKTRRGGRIQQLAKALEIPQPNALGFSALSRDGRDALWARIRQAVGRGR